MIFQFLQKRKNNIRYIEQNEIPQNKNYLLRFLFVVLLLFKMAT